MHLLPPHLHILPVELQMPKLHDMAAQAVWNVPWKLLHQLLVQLMQQQMMAYCHRDSQASVILTR